ncbi:MAG: EAL domain-containing protein [Chloroflexota bacterium]
MPRIAMVSVVAAAAVYALLGGVAATTVAQQPDGASTTASQMVERELAIEARLLVAASKASMARLANGVSGSAERGLAVRTVATVRDSDGPIVRAICIVHPEQQSPAWVGLTRRTSSPAACASESLRQEAEVAAAGTVVRAVSHTQDGDYRLVLASRLGSTSAPDASVLSVEVDVAALLEEIASAGAGMTSSMLVDLDSGAVVGLVGRVTSPTDSKQLGAQELTSYVSGFLAGTIGTTEQLASRGLAASVVPLWEVASGARLGLAEVGPVDQPVALAGAPAVSAGPSGAPLALLIMAIIVAVSALVLLAFRRFRSDAGTEARLQLLFDEAQDDSFFDSLTGLGNHRSFQDELTRQGEEFEALGVPVALALIDVDDLQAVNDRMGQAAGDDVLVGVVETMQQLMRPEDRLYRIGGDEFAMLMPGVDIDSAVAMTERVLHFCRRPPSRRRPSSFSAGVSGIPYLASDRDILRAQAQKALEWVKGHGRGSVEAFDPDRDRMPDHPLDVARSAVREVITGHLLSPVFQPIVDLQNGRVLGFEALIRPDPNGPLPDTARLFAAAAASGRTVELDLACIEVVLMAARHIEPDRLLTLNLSPRTLEVKDFDVSWLLDGLMRNGISPSRVILELTERDAIKDLPRLQRTFEHLQSYGLRLAADDVGAGNSGLRLLSQVRFDIVKIDLSLVQDGTRDPGSHAVLRSLRDLALSQNAVIVAEGVETAAQLQVIQELQIGAGQGFLLGRPGVAIDATFVDLKRLAASATAAPGPDAASGPRVVTLPASALGTPRSSTASEVAGAALAPRSLEPSTGAA